MNEKFPYLLKKIHIYELLNIEQYKRYGSINDGGYIIYNNINNTMYSLGIGGNNDFELDIIKHFDINMHVYDKNISSTCMNSFLQYKNIRVHNYHIFSSNQFQTELYNNDDEKKQNMFLKMDIEGAEYTILNFDFYNYFEQIVIELHNLINIIYYKKIKYFLNIINKYYNLIHIHTNNFSKVYKKNNIFYPDVIEMTLLHKKYSVKKNTRQFPTILDSKNNPNKNDIILNFYDNI